MFKTIACDVAPQYEQRVNFVVHPVVQPWHAQSSYMHEAAFAVLDLGGPAAYWEFLGAVYAQQDQFFDDKTWDRTRRDIYSQLADIAASLGKDKDAVLSRLNIAGSGNCGNATTQPLKWATKLHRVRGVHVTPTVFLNGLEASIIGSGWSAAEWQNFLDFHLLEADKA